MDMRTGRCGAPPFLKGPLPGTGWRVTFPKPFCSELSPAARRLVHGLLRAEPVARLTSRQGQMLWRELRARWAQAYAERRAGQAACKLDMIAEGFADSIERKSNERQP
jgi:hypothetical protein